MSDLSGDEADLEADLAGLHEAAAGLGDGAGGGSDGSDGDAALAVLQGGEEVGSAEEALAALEGALGGTSEMESSELAVMRERKRSERARGRAARAQRGLWERGLELRILLQRCERAAARLPPAHAALPGGLEAAGDRVARALAGAVAEAEATVGVLAELTEAVADVSGMMPDGAVAVGAGGTRRAVAAQSEAAAAFAAEALDEWGGRARVESGAAALGGSRRAALGQPVGAQVVAALARGGAARERLMARARAPLEASEPIGGHPARAVAAAERRATAAAATAGNKAGDPDAIRAARLSAVPRDLESFDDAELYSQMLRELLESGGDDGGDGGSADAARTARKRKKATRGVDTRASKGRKLRFNVIDKLVGFMAPVPEEEHPLLAYLRQGMFGNGPLNDEGGAAMDGAGGDGDEDDSGGEYDERGWKTIEVSASEDEELDAEEMQRGMLQPEIDSDEDED